MARPLPATCPSGPQFRLYRPRIPVGTPYKKAPTSRGLFSPNPMTSPLRGHVPVTETLQCLKKHGQRLDMEIVRELRLPLAIVRQHLTALAERREAIVCKTIQFENGRQ